MIDKKFIESTSVCVILYLSLLKVVSMVVVGRCRNSCVGKFRFFCTVLAHTSVICVRFRGKCQIFVQNMAIYALKSKVAYLYVDFMFIVLSWRADKLKKCGAKKLFFSIQFLFHLLYSP